MHSEGHANSYYAATAHASPLRPALVGDIAADACVIGAGYAGLSTALHLAEKGMKVVVLEAARVGFGASGRNGGQIINGYSRDYDTILSRYGADTASALLRMSFEGGDIIRERIAAYNIDCDYKPGGSFFAAFNQKQMDALARRKEVWESAGHAGLEMFDRTRTRNEASASDLYCGGLLDRRGGHIHPLNLALGEARALESRGGVIFENSRVLGIEEGSRPAAITASGRVTADYLIVCGNAYLGSAVPRLTRRIMPVSTQIITTEILGAEVTDRLMPRDYCLEDCNYLLDYYRITADKRLLFGGGVIYTGAEPADIVRRLWPHVLKTFPGLAGRKVVFAWSGNFALTLTRMPHVGRLSDKIYFIQGDSGHGVTTTHLLGRLTAEAIYNQAARFDVFAEMRNFPFPGGRFFRVPLTAFGAWYYGLRERLGI